MRRILIIILALALALPLVAAAAPSASPSAEACGPDVVHVVQRGENLFRISLRYGTTMGAIIAANGIANPNVIYAGQVLRIPCPSGVVLPISTPGGVPTLPPYVPTPIFITVPGSSSVQVVAPSGGSVVVPPPVSSVNCFGFRPTSPLDGMSSSSTNFYWDAASGAEYYRINVFNLDKGGGLVASYVTSGPFTRISGDTSVGALGEGFRFAWSVQAIANGQVVCATSPIAQWRAAS
ncbi:MAG: LysM peptidoglycan-binding domain-containing protein [Anaerolineae bacterium]